MKKILVLGSAGMLGHIVFAYFNKLNKYEVIDASFPIKIRPKSLLLDVTNKAQVEEIIDKIQPDIIINCIGILINGSQEDPSNAIYLNSFLPHQLSKLQRKHKGKLIHISTDCVFTGKKGSYSETDFKDARDTYGLSKALGEIDNNSDITIRTSIVGPELKEHGEGLFHWFMSQKGIINGYSNAYWTGVTTLELAKCLHKAIELDFTGLYNLAPHEKISKYDLLNLIKKVWKRDDIIINKQENMIIDKSLIDNRNLITVNNYETMFNELFEWMKNNKLYCNYK
ncbi:MAG: dTDP-4-dehydrorhamnose reductase family protein [Bacteroidales bacterium]